MWPNIGEWCNIKKMADGNKKIIKILPTIEGLTSPNQRSRYVHPFTDYGFKRLFGETFNKELLLDFINEILHDEVGQVNDIEYLNTERLGPTELDRGAIFDIYCKNEKGEYFIVELQKAKQNFFKERSVYYATFPIRDQAIKGDWEFELKGIYTIGILDFIFDDPEEKSDVVTTVKLCDVKTKTVFYDKLTFIYLEMPKFNKSEAELETNLDKWLYVFRNLHRLQERPKKLQNRVFKRLFEHAEIATFNQDELARYERSLNHYRDMTNVVNTAKGTGFMEGKAEGEAIGIEKGREEGEAIGIRKKAEETAIKMHQLGMNHTEIAEITGLLVSDIQILMKE